jgi:hypothetical protein
VRAELARVFGHPPGPVSLEQCWGILSDGPTESGGSP